MGIRNKPTIIKIGFAAIVSLFVAVGYAEAAQRSYAAKAEFKRINPCPANDNRRGPCPGWIVDHKHPLCAGGIDHHSNMQWQTVYEAKVKDRDERLMCR